jgi:hypothetical protein
MKTRLSLLFIVLALFAGVHQIAAQGTAFTYQGRLNNAGGAANGTYDLTFKLWNASSGGSQVGSTLTVSGVAVTNGLFTEILDFGGVFNGSPYWLELGVRTNGAPSFSTLAPRQELTPTPYAVTAENVDGLVSAAQLSGTLPSTVLSGTYGDPLNLSNPGNTFDGSFVGSGTGLTGVALLAGGNTFTGNQTIDGMLKISDGADSTTPYTDVIIGPGGYFPGEEHSINFNDSSSPIGSLILGYNGTDGYFSFGNLYHSTYQTGTEVFTVFGNGNVNVDPQNLNAGVINNGNPDSSGLTFGATSGEGIASQRTAGIDQYSLDFYTSYANRMTILQSGFIGINTTNPLGQLDVESANYNGIYINETNVNGNGIFAYANNGTSAYGVEGYSPPGYGVVAVSITGTGLSATSSSGTGIITSSGSGSALTIGSGAIHVTGASTNSTSTAAFTQVATAANIGGDSTIINNTLCNGDPNAILIVTPNWNPHGGPANYWNHTVGVYYTGSNWAIFNEDLTTMPAGPAFNVLIIKN